MAGLLHLERTLLERRRGADGSAGPGRPLETQGKTMMLGHGHIG